MIFVKFIPKILIFDVAFSVQVLHFILLISKILIFHAIINGIVLISFSDCTVLVCRNTHFCVLILYSGIHLLALSVGILYVYPLKFHRCHL